MKGIEFKIMANDAEKLEAARDQLSRTMEFFPRVDGKASVVLAINTSMLAILATRAVPYPSLRFEWIPIGLTLVLLGLSFWKLYEEAFPQLEGGARSLIYFREIAIRTESEFIKEWNAADQSSYRNDILAQVWRNSEILKLKFDHLKWAMRFLAMSLIPWIVALAWLSWKAMAPVT